MHKNPYEFYVFPNNCRLPLKYIVESIIFLQQILGSRLLLIGKKNDVNSESRLESITINNLGLVMKIL